jgi:phosphatidylglycerol:prolipoprotein diacylglycerol transferase
MTKTTKMTKLTKIRAAVYFCSFLLIFLIFVILIGFVFPGHIILPQFFHLGPLTIHYYGLIMAIAVAAGFYLAIKRAPQFGVGQKQGEDILFWTVLGGFIGARLYHVLSSFGYYSQNPTDILKVWNGGLSIYGAVLGGIITLIIYQRLNCKGGQMSKVTFDILDWLAPSVILGQIIGRFGNLFNYEVFGYPTNLPWKMFVPEMFRPIRYASSEFFHPWFLYEAVGNIIILVFLLKIKKFKSPGQLVFMYLLLYNSLRFCLEFLRIDSTFIGIFRLNAIVSLILILISVLVLAVIDKNEQKLKK